MYDLVIRGGQLVDGTGSPRRRADVGIQDGRVAAIGEIAATDAAQTVDVDGRIVSPGFVDVHTHLDVQGFWDPTLGPSALHGVTTALGGNCGFTVAPLTEGAGDYLMRMLARVEGMPLTSLEQGVPWNWTTTAEYLDALDGTLAINTGFSVGHSALRRVVMGEEATKRTATDDEVAAMAALLRDGLAAGGIGFSSTWAQTHNDAVGDPVPSRWADQSELVALAGVCREFEGTSLEFLPCVGPFPDDIVEVMIAMSAAAARPLNWNIISVTARSLDQWRAKLAVGDQAQARGAKVIGLVIPFSPPTRFNFHSGFVFDALPGWQKPMALPPADKLRLLADPDERRRLHTQANEPSPFRHLADWGRWTILETFSDETKRYQGRKVGDIATEEGREPVDVLFDIVVADELRTSIAALGDGDSPEDWQARLEVWRDPRAVIGASDAGAHLDMLETFAFSTGLLEQGVRKHQLLPLEEAVQRLTSVQADLYGLRDRGRLVEGAWADMVVFDEDTIGVGDVETRFDLPGGAGRLYAGSTGVGHVFVNGTEIVRDGAFTEARPGRMLRSGRDTYTASMEL